MGLETEFPNESALLFETSEVKSRKSLQQPVWRLFFCISGLDLLKLNAELRSRLADRQTKELMKKRIQSIILSFVLVSLDTPHNRSAKFGKSDDTLSDNTSNEIAREDRYRLSCG